MTRPEDWVHQLTPEGIVACAKIHVVRAIRENRGYSVTADPDGVTCPDCLEAGALA